MLFHAWLPWTPSAALAARSFTVGRGWSSMLVAMFLRRFLEPHPVAVAVVVGPGMRVASVTRRTHLAQDDHAGRTPVDAQRTTGADVVVDDEDDVVARILTRLFGVGGVRDGIRVDHVDALLRADVDAALAHDALGLVD